MKLINIVVNIGSIILQELYISDTEHVEHGNIPSTCLLSKEAELPRGGSDIHTTQDIQHP